MRRDSSPRSRTRLEQPPELRPEQRDVFILYEIEQLTMPQVADLLSCKLQTAYSRYKAAKEQVTTFVRRETRDD